MAANINQLMRRQSSRELMSRQFSRDVEARLEMSMMGDFYHGRKIHYSGGSFKIRARSKSEIPSRQRRQFRDKALPDFGDEEEPEPLSPIEVPKEEKPKKDKKVVHLALDKDKELPHVPSTASFVQPQDDEEGGAKVESWDSKITYILATVGYAVGLGNVWRFPYLAQKNGGGAFLIPYFIMLLIEGLPIFLLELAIGQRLRKGSIGAWQRVSPFLGGIGLASAVVSLNVALYYNTVIAWCLYYFGKSFQWPLPWSECPKVHFLNNMTFTENPECLASSPTQYFWYRETLNVAETIETATDFNWTIAVSLLLAWLLVYLCIIKGITENPIVIYITAIYPYVVLVIFFFRAVTLPGMGDGVIYLFTPKWEKLLEPVVWLEAGTQIFFSLGLAFGGLIAYSSYNPANNNCTRDAIFVAITNCSTSLFAGIIIFAIMGFKAHNAYDQCLKTYNDTLLAAFNSLDATNVPDNGIVTFTDPNTGFSVTTTLPNCSLQNELDNTASGTGLAFILFTEAVNQFPFANMWAVMFFLMLLTLGLDSQFGTLQGVVQCIVDLKLFSNVRKEIVTGCLCGCCFIISLCFAHGGGNYIFTLFDNFSGNIPLLLIAFFECIGVVYFYGVRTLARDIELMTGSKPSLYWMICWKYLSPLAMTAILIASFVQMAVNGAGYDAWIAELGGTINKPWPWWGKILIGILIGMSALWIPVVALLRLCGISLLPDEGPGWFPGDELKEFYNLSSEYEDSKLEGIFMGHKSDGREGILFSTLPPYIKEGRNQRKGSQDEEQQEFENEENEGMIQITASEAPKASPEASNINEKEDKN